MLPKRGKGWVADDPDFMTANARPVATPRSGVIILGSRTVVPFVLLAPGVFLVMLVILYPLARLIVESIGLPINFHDYTAVAADPTFWRIIAITFEIAAESTVATLVLGYPLAYLMAGVNRRKANILLLFVLVPFWTSILVRMYAWMALLGPHGPINEVAMAVTGARVPYHLLYDRFAVIVGMTHYLLPFMVLSLYATMLGIDRRLLEAAHSMGSSERQVFARIFFPLSLPGVYAGSLLVFILAIGFYVTPALLGGPADTTMAVYIEQEVELLEWGHATAMAVVLIAIVVFLFVLYDRVLGFNRLFRGMNRAG